MSVRNALFSPGSAFEGHLGKLTNRDCDQTLGAFGTQDPQARIAGETFLAHPCVVAAGEFQTRPVDDFQWVRESAGSPVRQVLCETGSIDAASGIDSDPCAVQIGFNGQTADIRREVDRADGALGAGEQRLMIGHTDDESPAGMPAPIGHAPRPVRRPAEQRQTAALSRLQPDAKTRVSVATSSVAPRRSRRSCCPHRTTSASISMSGAPPSARWATHRQRTATSGNTT